MCSAENAQKVDLQNSVSPAPKEEIDYVKLNKERISVASKLAAQLNNGVPPPNYRKGVVPRYDIITILSLPDFKLFAFSIISVS